MLNIDLLIDTLRDITFLPERKNKDGGFLFSVDHCFGIKGQGTVLTGTILNGQVKVNDVCLKDKTPNPISSRLIKLYLGHRNPVA